MRGTQVEFPDEGNLWVDFRYEGFLDYCLICGKIEHATDLLVVFIFLWYGKGTKEPRTRTGWS